MNLMMRVENGGVQEIVVRLNVSEFLTFGRAIEECAYKAINPADRDNAKGMYQELKKWSREGDF